MSKRQKRTKELARRRRKQVERRRRIPFEILCKDQQLADYATKILSTRLVSMAKLTERDLEILELYLKHNDTKLYSNNPKKAGDRIMSIFGRIITNVCRYICSNFTAPCDFYLDYKTKDSNKLVFYGKTMPVVKTEGGNMYLCKEYPIIDGEERRIKLAFHSHAIDRLRERIFGNLSPWSLYDRLNDKLYLINTHDKIYKLFFDTRLKAPQIMLDEIGATEAKVYSSLIYAPIISYKGRLMAKTILLPGYAGTLKERSLVSNDITNIKELITSDYSEEIDDHFMDNFMVAVYQKDGKYYHKAFENPEAIEKINEQMKARTESKFSSGEKLEIYIPCQSKQTQSK